LNVKIGDRVRLVHMPDDPHPIPVGTEGTVRTVTALEWGPSGSSKEWQLGVQWDNGRTLSVICPPDIVDIIPSPEVV
jgi:hypothetical protein